MVPFRDLGFSVGGGCSPASLGLFSYECEVYVSVFFLILNPAKPLILTTGLPTFNGLIAYNTITWCREYSAKVYEIGQQLTLITNEPLIQFVKFMHPLDTT